MQEGHIIAAEGEGDEYVKLACTYTEGNSENLPIVFIHGMGSTKDTWDTTVQLINHDHPTYAVDLRGHGESQYNGTDFSISAYINDLYHFITSHNLDKVILVAHSMGSRVATLFTSSYPNMVDKLVITDMDMEPREKKIRSTDQINELRKFKTTHKDLESVKAELNRYGYEPDRITSIIKSKSKVYLNKDQEYQLGVHPYVEYETHNNVQGTQNAFNAFASLNLPIMLIKASDDSSVTPEGLKKMLQVQDKMRFVEIPNSTHSVHKTNPDEYIATLNSFITHKPKSSPTM